MPVGRVLALIMLSKLLLAGDGATHSDWPSYGGTFSAWRHSALKQIDAGNVANLVPAWVFQTGDYENGLQATPIAVDGVVYLSTSSSWAFALDGATGRLIWEYHYTFPSDVRTLAYGKQNRGVAISHGLVFLGTPDNHLIALNQKTGEEVWKVNIEDWRQCGCNTTGAPLAIKDIVVAGVTGGDSAHRGYLTAFDAKTGRLRWRFYTIPGPGEAGHETWKGDTWKFGGGSTWMTGSFDPELNLLYWGVGNASSDLNGSNRKGDNLYTASIVALDPDTGKLKWHFQEVPYDVWDFDAAFEQILVDLPFGGRTRKVLLHPTKGGYIWMLDRVTGEFLKAWPFSKNINWVAGITETGKLAGRVEPEVGKSKLICPSVVGAKNWNQGAYSPNTGMLYLPVQELCNDLVARDEEVAEGSPFTGGNWFMKPPPSGKVEGYIAAFDAATGQRKWSVPATTWIMASILTTDGGLVFTGDPEGNFFALDARTGARLWSFQTGGGHRGSAISYSIGGRQYIATPTGWGSLVGAAHKGLFPDAPAARPGSALFVFKLPESVGVK
jgi:alcohol dehydrogenase (cytochrome c)